MEVAYSCLRQGDAALDVLEHHEPLENERFRPVERLNVQQSRELGE